MNIGWWAFQVVFLAWCAFRNYSCFESVKRWEFITSTEYISIVLSVTTAGTTITRAATRPFCSEVVPVKFHLFQ